MAGSRRGTLVPFRHLPGEFPCRFALGGPDTQAEHDLGCVFEVYARGVRTRWVLAELTDRVADVLQQSGMPVHWRSAVSRLRLGTRREIESRIERVTGVDHTDDITRAGLAASAVPDS